MIKFKRQPNENEGFNINMMPLIDIIFNLLIFFMITAAISTKGINLDLPEAESSEKLPSKSWEITINEHEQIILNKTVISEARLKKILTAEKNRADEQRVETIILRSNKNVPFGTFVTVMDAARKSGFRDLVIATETKISGPDIE